MSSALDRIQSEIISALSHVEAEDGLFFQNFTIVHESEERTPVRASDEELIAALEGLVHAKQVTMGAMDGKVIFKLSA